MNFVRTLGFDEQPDYEFLRELFAKVLKTNSYKEDDLFHWIIPRRLAEMVETNCDVEEDLLDQMVFDGGTRWEPENVSVVCLLESDQATFHRMRLSLEVFILFLSWWFFRLFVEHSPPFGADDVRTDEIDCAERLEVFHAIRSVYRALPYPLPRGTVVGDENDRVARIPTGRTTAIQC
jgi:hypothetical protein